MPGVLPMAVDCMVIVVSVMLLVGVSGMVCGRACHRRRVARYGVRGLVAGVAFPAMVIVVVFHGVLLLELDYLLLRLYPAAVTG